MPRRYAPYEVHFGRRLPSARLEADSIQSSLPSQNPENGFTQCEREAGIGGSLSGSWKGEDQNQNSEAGSWILDPASDDCKE